MANMLKKLREENNEQDKLLTKENSRIMMDMVVYLRSSNLCDYDIEVIRRELFGMIYEAQLRNEPTDQVMGEDYKSFCDQLMKNGRQKDFYEKFLEWANIIFNGIGILFAIEIVFSGFILELFIHRNTSMPVTLGFVISTVMIIAGAVLIYWFITKHSFELPGSGWNCHKIFFAVGFGLYFAGTIIVKVLLDNVNLLHINVLIVVALLAVAVLSVKILENRKANLIAKTHR